jgi:hypothetical protein
MSTALLFEDIVDVKDMDRDGKRFEKGMQIKPSNQVLRTVL